MREVLFTWFKLINCKLKKDGYLDFFLSLLRWQHFKKFACLVALLIYCLISFFCIFLISKFLDWNSMLQKPMSTFKKGRHFHLIPSLSLFLSIPLTLAYSRLTLPKTECPFWNIPTECLHKFQDLKTIKIRTTTKTNEFLIILQPKGNRPSLMSFSCHNLLWNFWKYFQLF